MVCFHCPTPIPIPIPMKLGSMIMCRTVSTEPRPTPIPIPMANVPNLALISLPIRWNLTNFHCNFCIGICPSGAFVYFIGIGVGIGIGIGVEILIIDLHANLYLSQIQNAGIVWTVAPPLAETPPVSPPPFWDSRSQSHTTVQPNSGMKNKWWICFN